jgi:cell division septation protein DedD
MKKHRKQNQKPTPAPQTAAPAGRSDDDFARQLAALFRSELGTEAEIRVHRGTGYSLEKGPASLA